MPSNPTSDSNHEPSIPSESAVEVVSSDCIPHAIVLPNRRRWPSAVWLLTLACALLSVGLFYNAYRSRGEWIEIEFEQGYGLQTADSLRFRGIEIGRVESITLRTNPTGITVGVRLSSEARTVITEGTSFWIARPVVSLEAVRGLETIIGPKYIAMEPGQGSSSATVRFIGLESPPTVDARNGAIEIVLDSLKRYGLESGAPILHRGFRVGDVLSVGLASDARSVIVRCAIDPEYHELVRSNSKFWVRSGWRLDVGLGGIRLEGDSLGEILYGGIEFATPDSKGELISTGARFELNHDPLEEWLAWQPSLPFGAVWERMQLRTPQVQRTALRWKEKSFGFTRSKQTHGWAVLLDDNSLVCRGDFAIPPDARIANSAILEVAGASQPSQPPMASMPLSDGGTLVRMAYPISVPSSIVRPSATNPFAVLEAIDGERCPSDLLLIGPDASTSIILDAGRLTRVDQGWLVDPSISVPLELNGTIVIALPEGKIIGTLNRLDQRAVIATLTRNQ